MSFIVFSQSMATAVFISVGNAIFDEVLKHQLPIQAPHVNPQTVIQAGATGFRNVVGAQDLDGIISAYAASCRPVFILAAVASAVAFFTTPLIGRIDVRQKKKGTGQDSAEKSQA
jgi:hypothetical protein